MSVGQYIKELVEEKETLNPTRYAHAIRMLEDEIYRMRITDNEEKFNYSSPVYDGRRRKHDEEIVEMCEKIIIPVNKYPNYNFIGKILGPKGNTLKAIQSSSKTKISILGRGSMRDKEKEEELIKTKESKYEHLKEPLHILVQVEASKSEAHARLASALSEVKKFMIPDSDKIGGYISPYEEEVVKMSEKVILPVKQNPKYNFVGKLLGPKGNILKSMQSNTQTKITILGRGSTRDKEKEEELLQGGDTKYKHLKEPLHVLVQVEAPRSEAHVRIAAALNEIYKYIDPENMGPVNNFYRDPDVHFNYRGQTLPAPLIRIGIPPPGSIILSRPLSIPGRGTSQNYNARDGNKR